VNKAAISITKPITIIVNSVASKKIGSYKPICRQIFKGQNFCSNEYFKSHIELIETHSEFQKKINKYLYCTVHLQELSSTATESEIHNFTCLTQLIRVS